MTYYKLHINRRPLTRFCILAGVALVVLLIGWSAGCSYERVRLVNVLDQKEAHIERLEEQLIDLRTLFQSEVGSDME